MIGIKGILIVVVLIVLFGNAIYDVGITGARCGMGLMGYGNYTCGGFFTTLGGTFVFPDRNIAEGVDSIILLRQIKSENPELFDQAGSIISTNEATYRNQIFIGIAGNLMLIVFLMWLAVKSTPSSLIHIDSKFASIMLALVFYCLVYVCFTAFIEHQPQLPFSGTLSLIQHPEVLSELVDYSAVLPGTTMISDYVNLTDTGGDGNP